MIIYTHIYNKIAKFLYVITSLAAVVAWNPTILEDLIRGLATVAIAIVLFWPIYYFLFRHIANWFYCALTLRTILSWADLQKVACLFDLDAEGEWMPMTEVRTYQPDLRRESLLDAAKWDDREFGVNRYL